MFPGRTHAKRHIRQRSARVALLAFALAAASQFAVAPAHAQQETDTDTDGVVDTVDLDADNDGVTNVGEGAGAGGCRDSDDDGVCDHLDLDSDNDGISDLIESGLSWGVFDIDRDGVVDAAEFVDDDADGMDDALEAAFGPDLGTPPIDTDRDGIADLLDPDSDNDWIPDAVEAVPTDGYAQRWGNDGNVRDDDLDGDGVWAAHDTRPGHGATFVDPVRSDGDELPDYRDDDSDGDGTDDQTESGLSGPVTIGPGDPDGLIGDPAVDLANQSGDTSEVGYRELPVIDSDGDGIPDSNDPDPDDPCLDPTVAEWIPIATNDCDGDGQTVGAGDPNDFEPNVPPATTTPPRVEPEPEPVETPAPPSAPNPPTGPATDADAPTSEASAGEATPNQDDEPARFGDPDDSVVSDLFDDLGPLPEDFSVFVQPPEALASVEDTGAPLPGDQAVAGASTMRVVGELLFDVDADGDIDDASQHLDGAVVELWEAGADDEWQTDDDVLVSSGIHDGGYELPAQTSGEFEVRVVVSSLPSGVVVPDVDSSRQRIGTATVRNGEVELTPFAYQPHVVCGQVTAGGEDLAGAAVEVTDSLGNTVETVTDGGGEYCAIGSLDEPLESGTATVSASKVGVSVLASVVIDEGDVEAPILALDGINLDTAATALGFDQRSTLSDLAVVGVMALFVGLLASLVMRMVGGIPIESDPDDLVEC